MDFVLDFLPRGALETDGTLPSNSDLRIASTKALRTYVRTHAPAVFVEDYRPITADDDAAIVAALAAGTALGGARIVFGDKDDYEIAALHAFLGGNVPVGQGSTLTVITATNAAAGIRVGPALGNVPTVASEWGRFTFDGDDISTAGVVSNTITADCFDLVAINLHGNGLYVYGQNNDFYNVNVGGCKNSGHARVFDNGAGQNRFWGCRFSDAAGWLTKYQQTVDSSGYAYAIPQQNWDYDPIIEQQSLAFGDGLGAVLQEAGAGNGMTNPNIFHPKASALLKLTPNPASGRSGDISGRFNLQGRTELIGGGAGVGQYALETSGVLVADAAFVIGGDLIVSGCEGGAFHSGSALSSVGIAAHYTPYGSGAFWTAFSGGAAGPAGIWQVGNSLGFGRLPGGTVSVEAAGHLMAMTGLATQVLIGDDGGYPAIMFGLGYDPVLYSLGAGLLHTGAKFTAHGFDADAQKITQLADGTASGDAVNKGQLDALIAAADALVYKGAIDCSGNPNFPAADAGHLYRVSVAGKIGGASGDKVEVGDTLLCHTDGTASGTKAGVGANWDIIQVNIDGAVVGPASATDGRVAVYDGATGKLIKDGGTLLSALATLASPTFTGTVTVPTQSPGDNSTKAASTAYVDATALVAIVSKSADYTLALTEAQTMVKFTHATVAQAVTVPPSVFPVGTVIEIVRYGAAAVTIVAGGGVTIHSPGGLLSIANQYGTVGLVQVATDEWLLSGNLA